MSTPRKASGLRRSVLEGKSRNNKGRGGWRGSYRDRHDLSKAEEEDILLTRGSYPNPNDPDKDGEPGVAHFHTCVMHGVKLRPKGPGSYYSARCNIDAGQDDCLLCMRQKEGDRRIGDRETYSFNMLHLALYHRVEVTDDKGRPRKYEEGDKRGQTIMTWAPVDKPSDRKRILADLDQLIADGEVCLFRKKYIEVGGGHRDELAAIDEAASKMCKCGGELTPTAFFCEECEHELANVDDDDMTKKDVLAFSQSREKCKKCGHIGLPVPENVCSDCDQPDPLTAFDVVATVRKEGEGTNSHIVIKRITPLDQYQLPNGDYLIEWEKDGKEYYPKLDEDGNFVFVEDMDVAKAVSAQWNFEEVHAPRDHEYHAEKLGCSNPFPATGKDKYRRYGGATSATDDKKKDEDEGPRRRRRASDDKDDDRGRGKRDRDDDDDDKDDKDDEDETPRRRRRIK